MKLNRGLLLGALIILVSVCIGIVFSRDGLIWFIAGATGILIGGCIGTYSSFGSINEGE